MSGDQVAGAARVPRYDAVTLGFAVAGLLVSLAGQARLDAQPDKWFDPLLLYIAGGFLWWKALRRNPVVFASVAEGVAGGADAPDRAASRTQPAAEGSALRAAPGPALSRRRVGYLAAAAAIVLVSGYLWPALSDSGGLGFLSYPGGPASGANHITLFGLAMWSAAIILYLAAVTDVRRRPLRRPDWLDADRIRLSIPTDAIAVLGIMGIALWFRVRDLAGVPLEMTSDHTEKLSDVVKVLDGLRPVFFEGNAGREPLQFYWTALLVRLGMPNDFLTLKLGMVVVSVATIPIVYLLGRRVAGNFAGLLAALALALAPWHVQITRIGLRIAWSPLFVAIVLVLLFRALETGRRNDWVAAGLASGLGVYGYTGFRPMALVIPATILLWLAFTRRAGGLTREALAAHAGHAVAAAGAAIVVLVPLLRYAADRPDFFWLRTFSRVTDTEVAIAGPVAEVFVSNWKNALLMFNLKSDAAWFQSPMGRPALETVGGALFVLGVLTAVHRAARGDWRAAALLVAVPALLTSSALSLAFPVENPSLSRAAGGVIPAVILIGLAVDALARHVGAVRAPWAAAALFVLVAGMFVSMSRTLSERYFVEYRALYDQSTHPTIELAGVLNTFKALGGDLNHAYFVGWQHGPDVRAIGQLAGDLNWGGLLWGADDGSDAVILADAHVSDPGRKMYLVGGPLAASNIAHLQDLFPGAVVTAHKTKHDSKDFWSVFVPGEAAP